MAIPYAYREIGRGVDNDGFYKVTLERSDARIVRVSKARLRQLRERGQLVPYNDPAFVRTVTWIKELEEAE